MINPATGNHFAGSLSLIPVIGQMGYIALTAFAINAVVAAVLTVILNAAGVPHGDDETITEDYSRRRGRPARAETSRHDGSSPPLGWKIPACSMPRPYTCRCAVRWPRG